MKVIKEVVRKCTYKNRAFKVYVTESATNFYCSAQRIGFALPCSENWKYSKKKYKTIESAIDAHLKEVAQRYGY